MPAQMKATPVSSVRKAKTPFLPHVFRPNSFFTDFPPSPIVMLVRLVQPTKATEPIVVTPSGIVMFVRLVHPWKECQNSGLSEKS
jgi:hypothetical protein